MTKQLEPDRAASPWMLACLALAVLLSSLGTSIANVALPELAAAFGATFQQIQWVVLAYLLAITTLVVGAGRLGDMLGRRRLMIAGMTLFTLASAACGISATLEQLIAARAVQGLGAAIMMALATALVARAVPKAKTGSAMGLLGSTSAVGTALGPSLGGALLALSGWQAAFLVNVPLGLLALLLAWRHLPADDIASDARGFDIPGTALLAVTLAAYALAMTIGRGHFGPLNLALLLGAAAGLALFVAVENRAASPLIRPSMLREEALAGPLAMNAIVSTVMMTTLVIGPFYLARALGLDASLVGLAMSAGPIGAALAGAPAGRIVDRFGTVPATRWGLAGVTSGCGLLALVPVPTVPGYVVPVVIMTIGYALFQAANNTAVMANVAADRRGLVSGMLNLSRNLGLVTGASLMGAVFAFAAGTGDFAHGSGDAVANGMRATFAIAALLAAAAFLGTVRMRAAPMAANG